MSFTEVHRLVEQAAGEVLHRQQVQSLAHAVVGTRHADVANIATVSRAAARVREVSEKHSIKPWTGTSATARSTRSSSWRSSSQHCSASGGRSWWPLDWTEFAPDEQATVAISMLTEHGWATPLLWQMVSKMKHRRASYDDRLLRRLR